MGKQILGLDNAMDLLPITDPSSPSFNNPNCFRLMLSEAAERVISSGRGDAKIVSRITEVCRLKGWDANDFLAYYRSQKEEISGRLAEYYPTMASAGGVI